jgi:hypothetical protein
MNHNKTQKNPKRAWAPNIHLYSNPRKAQAQAYKYLGKTANLYPGTLKGKNIPFMIKKIIVG